MGYDVYFGKQFPGAVHAFTIDDRSFDAFIGAHRHAFPPFLLMSRMNDPYGDANYLPEELAGLGEELKQLEKRSERSDVRSVCQQLHRSIQSALVQKTAMFCRGD